MVGEQAFQLRMESGTMIGLPQMGELVQEDVILQGTRYPHEVQIQVDVPLR